MKSRNKEKKSLRVGIIGCGRQAPKHISGYQAYGNVELTVSDIVNDSALAYQKNFQHGLCL